MNGGKVPRFVYTQKRKQKHGTLHFIVIPFLVKKLYSIDKCKYIGETDQFIVWGKDSMDDIG